LILFDFILVDDNQIDGIKIRKPTEQDKYGQNYFILYFENFN
jgi:hypothetical protein